MLRWVFSEMSKLRVNAGRNDIFDCFSFLLFLWELNNRALLFVVVYLSNHHDYPSIPSAHTLKLAIDSHHEQTIIHTIEIWVWGREIIQRVVYPQIDLDFNSGVIAAEIASRAVVREEK
jgi:hypothetical protein